MTATWGAPIDGLLNKWGQGAGYIVEGADSSVGGKGFMAFRMTRILCLEEGKICTSTRDEQVEDDRGGQGENRCDCREGGSGAKGEGGGGGGGGVFERVFGGGGGGGGGASWAGKGLGGLFSAPIGGAQEGGKRA